MKNITATQQQWLANNPSAYRADVLTINLPNGKTINAAMAGTDVAWNGTTYYATAQGVWERGAAQSEAMTNLESKEMDLTVVAADDVYYPGTTIPMAQSFVNGAWDASKVRVTTLYAPFGSWNDWQVNMVCWAGVTTALQRTGRSKAQITVNDWLTLCNLQVPLRIVQPSCYSFFGDARCTFSLASIGIANTVATGSTAVTIIPATAWPATDSRGNSITASYSGDGYFAQGKITWTSGNNSGFTSHVQSQNANGSLVLTTPPVFPVVTGDGFTAYAGCQKTFSDCKGRWGNQAHFSGFPYVTTAENAF